MPSRTLQHEHTKGSGRNGHPSVLRSLERYLYYPSNGAALTNLLQEHDANNLIDVGAQPKSIDALTNKHSKLRLGGWAMGTYVVLKPGTAESSPLVSPVGMVTIKPTISPVSRSERKEKAVLINAWVDVDKLCLKEQRLDFSGFAYNVVSTAVGLARQQGARKVFMINRSAASGHNGNLAPLDCVAADPVMLEFEAGGVQSLISDGRYYVAEVCSKTLTS